MYSIRNVEKLRKKDFADFNKIGDFPEFEQELISNIRTVFVGKYYKR